MIKYLDLLFILLPLFWKIKGEEVVSGVKSGDTMVWDIDLGQIYSIDGIRITKFVTAMTSQNIRAEVTTLNKSNYKSLVANQICNSTYDGDDQSIIIKCCPSTWPGRFISIIGEDSLMSTKPNITVDICKRTSYGNIAHSNLKIDVSGKYNSNSSKALDGNMASCYISDYSYSYRMWWAVDLPEEITVEACMIINTGTPAYDEMNSFVVQISAEFQENLTERNTCFKFINDGIFTSGEPIFMSCKKGPLKGKYVSLIKMNNHTMKICEFYIFGIASKDFQFSNLTSSCAVNSSNKYILTLAMLLVIAVLVILLTCLLCRLDIKSTYRLRIAKQRKTSFGKDLQRNEPIKLNNLLEYNKQKIRSGELVKEFQSLPSDEVKPSNTGKTMENFSKNRFQNILPFDDNLLTLNIDEEESYINASFIKGYGDFGKTYIATQGPKLNTVNDFWRMIWQYKVETIVMLTQLTEGCVRKCKIYWPDKIQKSVTAGDIKVTLTMEKSYADYASRQFVVQDTRFPEDPTRTIKHMQFLSWEDKSRPDNCFSLLAFRQKVRTIKNSSTSPLLVHCSAGVGRTGTYIAIDYLLDEAEQINGVSMYKCVKELRLQRMNMVQTSEQYIFVHEAVAEAVTIKKTGITCENMSRLPTNFLELTSTLGNIRLTFDEDSDYSVIIDQSLTKQLNRQFKLLDMITQNKRERTSDGLSETNIIKNRNRGIVAYDDCRVAIERECGNHNNYINAVTVSGYRMVDAYILTQVPFSDTVGDFWYMVWQYNLKAILLLEDCGNDSLFKHLEGNGVFAQLKIHFISQNITDQYCSVRQYVVVNTQDKTQEPLKVAVFQMTKLLWKEQNEVPENIENVLKILKKLINTKEQLVLQCLDGCQRSGLIAAALYMMDMMRQEEMVDPFLACRYVLSSRPQAIYSFNQYKFLYELARECLETPEENDYFLQPRDQLYENLV